MQNEQQSHFVRCDWEVCHKRLKDFCFVSAENDKYYRDEICASRDLQDTRASKYVRVH